MGTLARSVLASPGSKGAVAGVGSGGRGRENPWGLVGHSSFSELPPKAKLFWRELGDGHGEGGKKVREEGVREEGSWGY